MKRIVVATRNRGKLAEIREALAGLPLELIAADEIPGAPAVEESGETFFDNAAQKALALARHSGLPALADDSGLEVEALGGAPGIYSARYAGPAATDADNIEKLLAELSGRPGASRSARFVAVIALALPGGGIISARGECEGEITREPRGEGGFGYDPVFFHPRFGRTFAEISSAEKLSVSHRGAALRILRGRITDWLGLPAPDVTRSRACGRPEE